tara:strand:+ start:654 stop:1517 length:864 start_codon:yes stop_codon:yes gene_type:complete
MANYKTTETQVEKAGLFNHNKPKEGSIRDVHQRRKEAKQTGKAAELEINKNEKYQDQSVIDKSSAARDAYEVSVQTRADQKDWSDRKRARVERKKGIELGDQDVMYTEDTWQRANEQKRLGSLPGHTTTTDIDRDRFKNTYTLSGKYKGTREKPIGGIKDSPNPKKIDRDFHKSVSKEFSAATSWDMNYKRKHKVGEIKKWKEEGRDVSRKDLLTKRGQRKLRTEFVKDKIPGAQDVINKLHQEYYGGLSKKGDTGLSTSTHSKTQVHNYDTTNEDYIYKGKEEKNK